MPAPARTEPAPPSASRLEAAQAALEDERESV
jgi:hypothetical protein